jgi:O-antigen/teichoic acid export membrane protein
LNADPKPSSDEELEPRIATEPVVQLYSKHLLWSGVGQLLKRAASAVAMILVIRFLSRSDYGLYSVLLSIAPILGLLASWGWPAIYLRYIPALKAEGHRDMITALVVRGMVTRALMVGIAVAGLIVFFEQVDGFFDLGGRRDAVILFSLGLFAFPLVQLLQVVLTAHFEQRFVYRVRVSVETAKACLLAVALLGGLGLAGVLVVETAALVTVLTLFWSFTSRHVLVPLEYRQLGKTPSHVRRYGLFGYLDDMGTFFLDTAVDSLIIARYLGLEYVAIYSAAAFISKQIRTFVPTALLRDVLEPLTYTSYQATPTGKNLNRIFRLLTKINFLLLIPAFLVLLAFGEDLLSLFLGASYQEAYPYLVVLSVFFFAERFPVGYVTKAKERMDILAISKLFSVYNLVLSLILIRWLGLFGVVLATGSAQLFKQTYIYWHTKRLVPLRFPGRELLGITLGFTLVVYLIKIVSSGLGLPIIATLAILLAVLAGCTWAALRSPYFDASERGTMLGLAAKVLSGPVRRAILGSVRG